MNKLIELIEKGNLSLKRFLETNICERFGMALLQGLPVILFSSIFILIAYVPKRLGIPLV